MMEVKNIVRHSNHQDVAATQNLSQSTLSALPSWIGVLSEVSPILSGVASLGGFINSVVSARATAAFQQDLLSSLQSIQSTLNSIATDLNGIEATLQALATELQGLALSDKITSIENWGIYLSALPTDMTVSANLQGAQNLAASMMDADNGATNLQACMLGIHNAMVGGDLGSPLIAQITPEAFFQLRGRLVQGLHLLAFATAFNPGEPFDYGTFLLIWSNNFQAQTQCYLEYNLEPMVPMASETAADGNNYNQTASDGIVQYAYLQPNVPNVTLQVTLGNGAQFPISTADTLTVAPATATSPMQSVTATGQGYARVDIYKNTITIENSCPLNNLESDSASLNEETPLFYICGWYSLSGYYNQAYVWNTQVGNLQCGARTNPNQVFLGGCYGQTLWVEAGKSLLVAIFEGSDLTGQMFTYDTSPNPTVNRPTLSNLATLTGALWSVSMVGQGTVSVQPQMQGSANLYLTQGSDGTWSLVPEVATLSIDTLASVPGPRGNPFNMASTNVLMFGDSAPIYALFYQF